MTYQVRLSSPVRWPAVVFGYATRPGVDAGARAEERTCAEPTPAALRRQESVASIAPIQLLDVRATIARMFPCIWKKAT